MTKRQGYVLGESERAARRLAIQDIHFGEVSELLLDDLALKPGDRVVELGCGAGSFTRRVLARLGAGGVLVGIDQSAGLLEQAKKTVAGAGTASFEPIQSDIAHLGDWLAGANVVVARTVLHHVPMVEFMLGRLRAALKPGAKVGFLEPDFRTPLARVAYLEATGRTELAPLGVWARAINQLYQANRLSPDIGSTLGATLAAAGYSGVRSAYHECRSDATTLENMGMFYEEVREQLPALGILSAAEVEEQIELLKALPGEGLPGVWGIHRVSATA